MMNNEDALSISRIVRLALTEDLGDIGDITSRAIFDRSQQGRAVIKSKDTGVLSGAYLLRPIFHAIDGSLTLTITGRDGQTLEKGTRICTIEGCVQSILAGERIALNFLQRLSGIATATAGLVNRISHTGAKLLDTRKTTPLLRRLEKRAVLDGGGANHRFGLFDMMLIKDTHVKAAGGVAPALTKAKSFAAGMKAPVKIEIEVQTWDEFMEALRFAPDRVMLDNMDPQLLARCVSHVRGKGPAVELEASGAITEATIVSVAETGVDYISVGAITHSIKALDIHLVIE